MSEQAEVLEWINEVRASVGGEPILFIHKGWAHEPEHCPLTRSLMVGVINYRFRVNTGSTTILKTLGHVAPTTIVNPEPVRKFIVALDGGKHPEYIMNEPLYSTSSMLRKYFLPELDRGYYED